MPPTNDDFDSHEWKSEFASTRSGRNSPNIFAKVRRKLLLTPPVRNARSPRLTDEELDALTGDLPYATNYTYAYSKIYDPSLPDHWEVPNLAGGATSRTLAEQEHYSAASLSRQLLYVLRFPLYLIVHVITYILEAFYHLIKLSTFTLWDYILYIIKIAKIRYATYQDYRRRTALIRNRQDPFSVKAANFFRRFFEFLFYIVSTPYRLITMVSSNKNGVDQYEYKSIKDQLENERASRVTTRSQALGLSRRFQGLSQSPARHSTPAVSKTTTNTITRITTRVFSNSLLGAAPSGSNTVENHTVETTPVTVTTRTVRERSVTPRFRTTRNSKASTKRGAIDFDSPEVEVDTPLSTYGLRSRNRISNLNTPEPTFDIGNAMATSTPLSPRDVFIPGYVHDGGKSSTVQTVVTWIGYLVLFPFFAARHIWYTIFDYGKSAYMKFSNYQPTAMEAIRVRDSGEPAPTYDYSTGMLYMPWTTRVSNFFSSFFAAIKESHQIVFAMFYGVIQDTASYAAGLFRGLTDKKSSRFSMCQLLGLLLALLLAFFLFGFLTSDNTAIRKELQKDSNASKSPDNALPSVPFHVSAGNKVKHYIWMGKEYVVDLVFNGYNYAKPILGRTITAPKYAWDLLASGCGAVGNLFGGILAPIRNGTSNAWYSITGGLTDAGKSIGSSVTGAGKAVSGSVTGAGKAITGSVTGAGKSIYGLVTGAGKNVKNGLTTVVDTTKIAGYYIATESYNHLKSYFGNFLESTNSFFGYVYSSFKGFAWDIYNFIYNNLFVGPIRFFMNNYPGVLQLGWNGARWVYDTFVFTVKTIVDWAVFLVTYPVGLATRAWVHISQYAPDDVVQVIPIPQAITPTPDVEPIIEEPEDAVDTLIKRNELGDEELVIIPAPAPEPIPVPVPEKEPVVIHHTNIVETVDKDAIIREVTEKLRAEFQQEMSAQFEQNYNSIIQKLKVENTKIQYDNNQLEAIIRQMIYEYDTDKTGKVDYALESGGGAVVTTRCSETYKSYTRLTKFWDIPMYFWDESPRIVIQRNSKSLFPGECWCFKEGRGYIAVQLSHYIDVASVSYEHIGKEVAPEGDRTSAPKGVLVWAYKQIDDINSRVLLGDYTYDLELPPLQFFIAKHKPDFPVKFVELEITSNYGAPYTCLYRIRVHGKMIRM
ncbi:unnamed protein product [Caenorhabditis brenneri]